jgi:hypothetical protein
MNTGRFVRIYQNEERKRGRSGVKKVGIKRRKWGKLVR